MIKFRYLPINNSKQYSSKIRNKKDIKGIVIHDTGNTSKGAGAYNHYRYLQNATRQGSAHYFVDDKEVLQVIGDSKIAWGVGDSWGYGNNPNRRKDLNNSNTISIEMCINSDGNYNQMYYNTVELVKNLMIDLNINCNNIVRHFDITGKNCPNKLNWDKFKMDILQPMKVKMDLSTSSTGILLSDLNNKVQFEINGKLYSVDGFMKDNVNYVSIRQVFELLGYTVDWDNSVVKIGGEK